LQHEFGIFGGDAGSHIIALLAKLTVPIATTLHTVLAEPNMAQRRVMREIADASTTVIVMAEKGRELLRAEYGVAAEKIELIPGWANYTLSLPHRPRIHRGCSRSRRFGPNRKNTLLGVGSA
jgi:glycosyl transferase family 4